MKNKSIVRLIVLLGLSVLAIAIVAACAAPAPAEPQVVVQTVVVKETVEVEKEVEVVQTVVVKETVEVAVEADAPAETECATAKDSYKIGFANLTEDIVFTQLVRESIESEAAKAGNIELVLADNKLDGATALANADNFILQGVDGVIEFQTDEKFGNVMMDKFRTRRHPRHRHRHPHAWRHLLRR